MRARTKILLACLLVLLSLAGWRLAAGRRRQTPPRPRQPNVLLISLDTVRPDHLGCYGYNRPTSPNLDRFARDALVFTQARSQAPWTLPSHMSLLSSMLPSSCGVDTRFVTLPESIVTLAQVLKGTGYTTAAIVNDALLQRTWGYARGYDLYEEHDSLTPDGAGNVITTRALQWLDHAPRTPWHLFLHYYDAHDPYHSPEPFNSRFGALPNDQTRQVLTDHFRPEHGFADPRQLQALVNSYDAGIAHLDAELGPLLDHIPPNTMVVIFSDHGEEFKEHGWLWHGLNLYDEEIRTVLMMRLPEQAEGGLGVGGWGLGGGGANAADGRPSSLKPKVPIRSGAVDAPVMLMDVAPTILAQCGLSAPTDFEGADLHPLLSGGQLPARVIASENKDEGADDASKCLVLPPWKYIYSMVTGREELYRLPDEGTNLIGAEPKVAASFRERMAPWVSRENFWVIYFTGEGEFTGSVSVTGGHFADVLPVRGGGSEMLGRFESEGGDRSVCEWVAHPGQHVQAIIVETSPPNATLTAHFQIDGKIRPAQLFVGKSGVHPSDVPTEFWIGAPELAPPTTGPRMSLGAAEAMPPLMAGAFKPGAPGYYIRRFGNPAERGNRSGLAEVPMLDKKALDQLRSLGYIH